ncbi:MAG TPA: phosphatase domain-containing protein [Kofleriaceae bacterium]|nr:phosphatase domain-containing protein [Kofleriaceae bacterium]
MRSRLAIAPTLALLAACVGTTDEPDQGGGPGGKADGLFDASELIEGTPPAVGLLRFVNDASTTPDLLQDEVDIASDAAANLVALRPFETVAEIDAVPRVGEATLQRLLDFAFAGGFVPAGDDVLGTYDDVAFTVDQAEAVVSLVNLATLDELDDDIALDARAADAIVEGRPIATVLSLSSLAFVDTSALEKLRARAGSAPAGEIGVVSDLDSTVIPPAPSGQDLPDESYPGVPELYTFLERGDGGGATGDVHYVTARDPSAVTEVPAWLAARGVPAGDISTGISGIPSIATNEKIRDITAVFQAHPGQHFVLFGDTKHVDPDVYRSIRASFETRVTIAFIHDVKEIDPARLEGLFLIDNYAQAAAELFRRQLLTEDQARSVMEAVVAGGEITEDQLEDLIADNRPAP